MTMLIIDVTILKSVKIYTLYSLHCFIIENGLIVENHEADRPRTSSADPNKSQACTIL